LAPFVNDDQEDERMAKQMLLLTVHDQGDDVTLESLMRTLGLRAGEVDMEYGLQMIDPVAGDYVLLVDADAAARIDPALADVSGPYANPEIEPFGPPER
jgi:hypothetical protein